MNILLTGLLAFGLSFLAAPFLIRFLHEHRLWRKKVRQEAMGGGGLPIFQKFHREGEVSVPRFGGMLVATIPFLLALFFFAFKDAFQPWYGGLNFLSEETLLVSAMLLLGSVVGFFDDILQVLSAPASSALKSLWDALGKYAAGGLSLKMRFAAVLLVALLGGLWLFSLGIDSLHIPFSGDIALGWMIIPLFMIVALATYSGGVIDGIDGLAGGAFAAMFASFGAIAFLQGQADLAVFSFAVVGSLLAFLHFNLPPAKFYMGETGVMGLCVALAALSFLTNAVLLLPVIGILLVAESGSVILQVSSKKLRGGKKIFLAAPLHHHFEGKGWSGTKIVRRFWAVGIAGGAAGVIVSLFA